MNIRLFPDCQLSNNLWPFRRQQFNYSPNEWFARWWHDELYGGVFSLSLHWLIPEIKLIGWAKGKPISQASHLCAFCFSAPESSGSSPGLSEVKQSLLCMCACVSVFFYGLICWQCAGVALQQQNLPTHTHTHTRCLVCRLWNHCAELLFSLNLDHPIRTVTELWLTVMNARPLPSALLARAEHAGSISTNTPALH